MELQPMEELAVKTSNTLRTNNEERQYELAEYLSSCLARVGVPISAQIRDKLHTFCMDEL